MLPHANDLFEEIIVFIPVVPCPERKNACYQNLIFLKDTRSWRPGRVVSVKSNGTFAVQYDSEKGSPTEDHVAENRLRIRTSFDKSSGHRCGRGHDNIDEDDEKFVEGDIVLAIGEGQEGKGSAMVTVAKVLTDNVYCMEYLDGSGTFKMESNQLRCVHAVVA